MPDDMLNALGAQSPATEQAEFPPVPLPEDGKRVKRRDLLNRLNFINFSEGTIFASFKHLEHGDRVTFQAIPRPCLGEVLDCRWLPPGISMNRLRSYVCDSFLLSDGHSHVTVRAEVTRFDSEGITFKIPESGYEKSVRKVERQACEGIDARLIQAGLSFEGRLADFNALSFKVELHASPATSLQWINPATPLNVLFSRANEILYTGECIIKRMDRGRVKRELLLAPNFNNIRRYRPRESRSQRVTLAPLPTLCFRHPFSGKQFHYQAMDISTAGVCVEEFFDRSVLLPGMVIPDLSITIANRLVLKSRAQVLYRNLIRGEGKESSVRCGIVLLDVEAKDQPGISALVLQTEDEKVQVCGQVDMEELWRFFFETGFIYPSKYFSIEAHKEEFKQTYERIYLNSPSIARHFIFRDKGQIFGHMSIIRYYSNSWMIQHHAASRDGYGLAGIKVLDQIGRYTTDIHLHPSARMDYMTCYFRKENRFPARVFGNVVRDIDDPKACSADTFAYLHISRESGCEDSPFQLFPAGCEDYEELHRVYEKTSGGLMLEALDLEFSAEADGELAEEFARVGFKRERHVFSLVHDGKIKAVLALTLSDLGLNLSNLANCVHAIILDEEGLPAETFQSGVRALLRRFNAEDVPVLIYPAEYLDRSTVPYEKRYTLWVLDMERTDGYFKSLNETFRRTERGTDE